MFTTMHAFLAFFIPTLVLILLGILFEERLVALEQKLKARLFRRQPAEKAAAAPRAQLHRVAPEKKSAPHGKNRAA